MRILQSTVWLIDEYSMVSAEMLEELDRLGKKSAAFPMLQQYCDLEGGRLCSLMILHSCLQ
jgi:hypothetical protein